MRGWRRSLTGVACAIPLLAATSSAGTTGRLSGRVVDAKNQPLVAVNVAIPAARLGAITDSDGGYTIMNLPAGTYDVRVSLLGYGPKMIRGVDVTSDNTTRLDVSLVEAPVELKEVVVNAKRPVVNVNLTSNLATVNRAEIQKLPVQELSQLVELQAGVVSQGGDLHFRGGRGGEVQYQVDGVSVNNSFDNKSILHLDRSILQDVQVITGTFDAEYGQAMSGVVNAVLRRGTDQFEWDAESMVGGWIAPRAHGRIDIPRANPRDAMNFQITASGPTRMPATTYLLNLRRGVNNDWARSMRVFQPTRDLSPTGTKYLRPDGDREREPLGFSHEWSGVLKLSNRSLKNVELNYQAVPNYINGHRGQWVWHLNPDGMTEQRTISVAHGVDGTWTLGKSSYLNFIARENYFNYRDMKYTDLYDPRYDVAGGPVGTPNYADGASYAGVDLGRFTQTTNALVLKSSYANDLNRKNHLKVGAETQWSVIRFGHPGYLIYTTVDNAQQLVRFQSRPDLPAVSEYQPVMGAAFAQDEIEWEDLHVRAGFRFDFFDARSTLPSDLANPANSIAGAPASVPVPTTVKSTISPRIGVSYPVTKESSLYFAYGHFYQMPALRDIFDNADYSILKDLQARVSYTAMGNPDIRPERTVQYQFGYKQAITENLGLDVNAFYKDIRDLLGTQFISTYNDAEYARLANTDFGSVIGVTVAVDQRELGPISLALDYTWQLAQGDASDPRETATRASQGLDARPRQIPFNWDQRHTLNLTTTLAKPDGYSVSSVLRVASGQPYTPSNSLGYGLEDNSGRKPLSWVLDLRGESPLNLYGLAMRGFARVFNVFDTRFFNGSVFGSSGNPYQSSSISDRTALGDPTRFYPPRRIEIGVTVGDAK